MADDDAIAVFSEEQAERLTGLNRQELRARENAGLVLPSRVERGPNGAPPLRLYSFRDLATLRILELVGTENGLRSGRLREVAAWLRSERVDAWARTTLRIEGGGVSFQPVGMGKPVESVAEHDTANLSLARAVDDARAAVVAARCRSDDEIGRVRTKSDASKAVLAGTRIRVASVRRLHEDGYDMDQIRAEYPDLTEDDVRAALDYRTAA